VRFERLTRGHVVAAVAALVLLLVMAMDWYGSTAADEARDVTKSAQTHGAQAGEAGRALKEDAQRVIARDEKNAWQEQRSFDRFILILLLACVFLPLFAAAHRASGRRGEPPFTPSAIAAIVAAITALLVAYRIINEPGNDVTTTVKIGAPLGLLCLAAIGLGSAWAFQGEAEWAEVRRTAATPPESGNSDEPPESPSEEPFDQTAN
jgi:drug/metabolite transporter (DMT)-like permease